MKEIETRLRTSLFSRRIPFNMYTFDNSTATIISMVRGNKLSVNLAHTVSVNDDGTFTVASYDKSKTVDSATAAVSWIITDIRKYEILFSKYAKRNS